MGRIVRVATVLAVATALSGAPPAGSAAATPGPGRAAVTAVAPAGVAPAATGTPTPRNVIVMIGDGMGFSELGLASVWQDGTGYGSVTGFAGTAAAVPGTVPPALQGFDVTAAMSTFSTGTGTTPTGYDPGRAWSDTAYLAVATDSAAAATAMATGVKTRNGTIGLNPAGAPVENLAERAMGLGKSAGVVTSVPFSHATPAGFTVHEQSRNDYHAIAHDLVDSDLSVVIGAGHPGYDDDHRALATPAYTWIDQPDWAALRDGDTPFTLVQTAAGFADLATAADPPDRVFGVPRVGSTLQEARSGPGAVPFADPRNDVPDLALLTRGALNVLDEDPDGLFLMVEGGAIDWAGHGNLTGRSVEETLDFQDAVQAVSDWVETSSSWQETLVIVTADHETGFLTGPGALWSPIDGERGVVPAVRWRSVHHTASLVPFFARGAGAQALAALADRTDPVRGPYLDNTDPADLLLELWATEFPDVTTLHPFYRAISWMAEEGVSQGYADGLYRPGNVVTRGAMAAFLYRYAGRPAYTPPAAPVFPDVQPGDKFYKEISWLASTGITRGDADGEYKPRNAVNRGAMAAFLYRYAGRPAYTPPATAVFPDVQPGDRFYKEISWLASTGITRGYADGEFKQRNAVSRGSMAAFLYRYDTAFGAPA